MDELAQKAFTGCDPAPIVWIHLIVSFSVHLTWISSGVIGYQR